MPATRAKLKPLGTRVLAQRKEAEEMRGAIILPDSANQKQETAVVLADAKFNIRY